MTHSNLKTSPDPPQEHHLQRQLTLRDMVLAQILTVVGSSWVGIAAGLGSAQVVVWLIAFGAFYLPMAVCVFYLNRAMPLEGGLYIWARRAFGDGIGFMTAWNVWAYAIVSIATILFQLPSEFSFMLGTRGTSLPENHLFVYSFLGLSVLVLMATALRGLSLGKWIHNASGAAMLSVFALLLASPVWAWLHHVPLHYSLMPHLPPCNMENLALMGQVLFAASGLEYIAIMAGEAHAPERLISRSVVIATPIIIAMFVLGTASVVSFHALHPDTPINYIAPIPQTLSLAFSNTGTHTEGLSTILAQFAILLLQLRILGAASYLFTGVTRLPMAAGWDHLVPEWFSRLDKRYSVPRNSVFFTTIAVALLLLFASLGVHASEAFAVLNNASSNFYSLAYLAMFLIPICGASAVRRTMPTWTVPVNAIGVIAILFILMLNAYPFVHVAHPEVFAIKIIGTTLVINALGYFFYRSRKQN